MFALTNLTLNNVQTTTAILADGSALTLTFRYRAAVQRWTVDISYPKTGFIFNGKGLSTHPNLLRTWRNVIPFGIQVVTADGTDPFLPSDLAPGAGGTPARVTVAVLDGTNGRSDLEDVEAKFFAAGAAPAY